MKDLFIIILTVLVIILFVLLFIFNHKVDKDTKKYEEEKYSRMVAEESLQKNAAKLAALEAQLKSANSKMSKVEELIDQQKGMNEDLKKEYEQLSKAKAELEEKLQAALNKSNQVTPTVPTEVPAPVEVGK